jgi:hypothetical protein
MIQKKAQKRAKVEEKHTERNKWKGRKQKLPKPEEREAEFERDDNSGHKKTNLKHM